MFETIEVKKDGAIGRLSLNRPDRLNALSTQVLEELVAATLWFDSQSEVRVVVVSGRGRSFSAGADLAGFPELGEANLRAAADTGRRMADAVEGLRALTIAAIHGWCVGGGLVLAAACDLRIAAANAKFSIPEVDLGIPLAWGGIPRLVREIGPALTKELVITCRPFDAEEGRNAGFINRVVTEEELEDATATLAKQIAEKPAFPVMATKRHVDAVTANMIGLDRSWADADSLIGGLVDEECQRAREKYIRDRLAQ
ncbi:MAG: enoyl-CoA hydratase/isomerase family protein [Pseudomonadota bacterium]